MPLQLKIISTHEGILEEDCTRIFGEDGGTIGRSLENDWILLDPQRYLSGKHATIDYQSGAYYLADVSTNGVYVNDEDKPLGKGNPRRLFSGDRLRMGNFSFVVGLDEGQDLAMPPPEPMTVVPDHIEQLVQEDIAKSGVQLLDEEALTGDAELELALFGVREDEDSAIKDAQMSQPNPIAPPPGDPQQEATNAAKLLNAFMKGLDISPADIPSSTDPLEVMENAGRVLREFVEGSTELLAGRTALHSMFRLDRTISLPMHNNPLKLAGNTRESILQLLVGREGACLAPVDAVREVCRDLKFHQDAVLEAIISSFIGFTDRFDPDELQQNFDKTLPRKPLFKSLNQLKYWQLYCDLYPIMTQAESGKFPHQFGEEFVRAYEQHVAEYQRLERKRDPQQARPVPDQIAPETFGGGQLVNQTELVTPNSASPG